MSDQWLTILVCGGVALLVTIVAAYFGIKSKLRFSAQVIKNDRAGPYRSPEYGERLAMLVLVQVCSFIVFAACAAFALMAKSIVAAITAGMALFITAACHWMWHRLMTRGIGQTSKGGH